MHEDYIAAFYLSEDPSVCIPAVQLLDGDLEVTVVECFVVLILESIFNDLSRQHIGAL